MNSIVVTSTKQNIKFGYEGEDNVTKIIFPYDESWLEYGEGNFEVRILRCGDEVAYTATEIVDDRQAMTLTMTVTDIELSVRGRGEMQLCYVCPDCIKKSPIYQYTVNRSVDYKYAVDPPEGSIIASVEKSLSEIKNTTNRLSNSVISIESSIDGINSQIDNINDKISEFDEEIDSIGEVETRVDNLETSIQSINGRINTAEGNINENTESISDLNESVTELENRKVTDLETSGGKSDSGKYLTVGTDGKIKATSLTIPPTITVDASLSTTSTNPVQNKVIKTELNNINSNIATCNTEISKINGSLGDVKADLGDTNDQLNELIESSFEVYRGLLSVSAENFTDMRASQGWNSLVISYNEHNDGFSVYHTANYNERFCWSFPVEATKTYTITFKSTSTDWVKVGVASVQTVNEANWTEISQENGKYTITFTVNQSVNAYYLCFALKNAGIGQANAITISGIICDEGDTAQLGYAILESAIPSTIVRQVNYYSLVAPSYIDLVNDGKWFFYDEGVIDTNDIHASDVYQVNSFGGTEPIQQFPTQGIRESDLTDYAAGHYTNRLYMCNTYDNNNIDSQLCVINVYDVPTNPTTPKNILIIGDSLTANNYLPYYFYKYLEDNSLSNYKTVGRRKATMHGVTYDSCKYEAEGGYSWQNYVDNPNTLPSEFPNNHFWNPTTNELDISYYMDTYANGANLDYVLINLGWNSLVNLNYWHGMNQTISEMETKAKAFINQVHTEYPNAKVLLTGIQKAPWDGAAFVSNANKPTLYNIRLARAFCSKLNSLYKSIATNPTYNGYVRFNQVSFQFNPYTGMPYKSMDTDVFTGNTISICGNYVHPSENGYKMFARSIWGGFVGLLNN